MAEDITQDVFVTLMQQADRFDPRRGLLTTYLYGISRNLARKRLSRGGHRGTVDLDDLDDGRMPALIVEPDPPADIDRTSDLVRLRRAILSLPLHYREVIVLCELHELSYEQAAHVVGCPIGTIRSRLNRARRALVEHCQSAARHREVADEQRTGRRCLA